MNAWHIHIKGRVQGVGFRPIIKIRADRHRFKGTVSNGVDGVHVELTCSAIEAHRFLNEILRHHPPAGRILKIHLEPCEPTLKTDFKIIESKDEGRAELWITPDIAMCSTCSEELRNQHDRRYNYAFTTCTQCGPRYSIMSTLPYDRPHTGMDQFEMCSSCAFEYENADDRRFYSQSNSCPECPVHLIWLKGEAKPSDPIKETVDRLRRGQTVAVKGIGGYLLLADAGSSEAVQLLRKRKNRPTKPFAILFPNLSAVEKWCLVTIAESEALTSPESPIVLLRPKPRIGELVAMGDVAPNLNRVGVMLPYAPLLQLIASSFGSYERQCQRSSDLLHGLRCSEAIECGGRCHPGARSRNNGSTGRLRDLFFTAFRPAHHAPTSRGYAPSSVPLGLSSLDGSLAMGAEMKSTFGIAHSGNTYLSQYLGNTSVWESIEAYQDSLKHLSQLLRFEPKAVIIDKHPNYAVSQMDTDIAKKNGSRLYQVQHHEAHFYAALSEHRLLTSDQPILGFVWDGTGYGNDGQIWGGECFLRNDGEVSRYTHLPYTPLISGDRMALNPMISAVSFFLSHADRVNAIHSGLSASLANFLLLRSKTALMTSSMGRLFDAVSALLEITMKNEFEGESAMRLQQEAERAPSHKWDPFDEALNGDSMNYQALADALVQARHMEGTATAALRFHQTLVEYSDRVACSAGVRKLAFSGGVFQNPLLVDLIIDRLGARFQCYFHELLPPGDENIAFGQLAAVGDAQSRVEKLKVKESCV